MLAALTLNSTVAAKVYLQVNLEVVNRESWESILNYTKILSCKCLNFLAFAVFLCWELLSRPE